MPLLAGGVFFPIKTGKLQKTEKIRIDFIEMDTPAAKAGDYACDQWVKEAFNFFYLLFFFKFNFILFFTCCRQEISLCCCCWRK